MAKDDNNGDMSVSKAGHLGGQKTSETHDHQFYSDIGKKGGEIGGQKVKRLIEKGKESEGEA